MELGWIETTCLLVAAVALFVAANRAANQPIDLARPRMWPPIPVMALAALVAIMMLAHMVTLATGRPFQGGGF
ncbi:MAG: hypothetical protein WCF85_03755 [Rhodospirillaceae bacterium]